MMRISADLSDLSPIPKHFQIREDPRHPPNQRPIFRLHPIHDDHLR